MGPKVGFWWGDGLFWGWKAHRIERPNVPRRRDPLLKDGNAPTPLDHAGPSFLFLGLSLLWVVSVAIYSSLPFILLLHLSVIHAYPQVHVSSAILSGALWAAVAPIALSKGHIHIKGGQGVSCVYLIRRWQLFLGLPIWLGISFVIRKWMSSGDVAFFFLPWFWPAEDRVVLSSTFWQFGFPSFVPEHFFLLSVGLRLKMEWTETSRTFWPHIYIYIYNIIITLHLS